MRYLVIFRSVSVVVTTAAAVVVESMYRAHTLMKPIEPECGGGIGGERMGESARIHVRVL